MMSAGPGEYFVRHPRVYAVALLGAVFAAVAFTMRALRASGSKRYGWITLTVFQLIQAAGIIKTKRRAARGEELATFPR